MLPIDSTKRLPVKDEEGNVFNFRYLLGGMQQEYDAITTKMQTVLRSVRKYQKKIETMSEEEIENDPEIEEKTNLVAEELQNHRKQLVDLFLAEVIDADGNVVEVKGKLSEAFPIGYIPSIAGMIQENLNTLTGNINDGQLKNSSRPHTSLSTENTTGVKIAAGKPNEDADA